MNFNWNHDRVRQNFQVHAIRLADAMNNKRKLKQSAIWGIFILFEVLTLVIILDRQNTQQQSVKHILSVLGLMHVAYIEATKCFFQLPTLQHWRINSRALIFRYIQVFRFES